MPKWEDDDLPIERLSDQFSAEILGPVVHRWLLALDQHVAYFDDGETAFLYCARAGVRIQELFKIYLEGQGRSEPTSAKMFWISRLALCQGVFNHRPDLASDIICREFYHRTLKDTLEAVLRSAPDWLKKCNLSAAELKQPGRTFMEWMEKRSANAKVLADYFAKNSKAFDAELGQLVGGSKRVVLIDSGWQGTGQSLLHHCYKDIDWHGLYVGRILTDAHDRSITDRAIGLLFQSETYDPQKPETSIVLHRHLFETLLEPNGPSIEEIRNGPAAQQAEEQIEANLNENVTLTADRDYFNVREYLRENASLRRAEILAKHEVAVVALAQILSRPTRRQALAVTSKHRSADFGKSINVPILVTDEAVKAKTTRDERVQRSLWPQGQIALEFEGKIREELQDRVTGTSDNLSNFDPLGAKSSSAGREESDLPEFPVVAIITRTKNRPLLFERAAESVACQTYEHYVWVVVNDGGDEASVRKIIENCAVDRRKIRLVSNAESLGMEAASNVGIHHVESDYVLIHDDDDSLDPTFLEKTIGYLESGTGARYGGVVTGSHYISEEIRGDEVIEHGRVSYKDWLRNIQLAELFAQNLFAPISFVYRRSIFDEIGGYNPALPVLGDWFFNLEFVLKADIAVMQDKLANYHHRDYGDSSRSGIYSNSVIGGQKKHEEFNAVCANMFIRKYAEKNAAVTGMLIAYFSNDMRNRVGALGGGGQVTAPVPSASALEETDRLWLLSHVVKKRRRTALTLPYDELAAIAAKLKLKIEPHSSFNESLYLKRNADVEDAVKTGGFHSGYEHYLLFGKLEGRPREIPT